MGNDFGLTGLLRGDQEEKPTVALEPGPRKYKAHYTDQERQLGLTALAVCSGRRDRAHDLLKEQEVDIPAKTLYHWATKDHVDEYQRIRLEIAPKLQAQLADAHQALATDAASLEAKTIQKLDERLNSGEVEDKNLANIFKAAAIAGGVHVDKAQLLNDKPTAIVKRDPAEIIKEFKSRVGVLEGEVISEEDVPNA